MKHVKWILLVPLAIFFLVWLGHKKNTRSTNTLPRLIELPAFELKNQDNTAFGTKNFSGKVSVVNFIFTNCPTVCPLLTQKMKEITQQLNEPEVQFVSVSVDPENDKPEVLKRYGERFGADWSRWSFVTGPLEQISDVVVKGFKIVFIRETKDLFDITHGEYFVVVDKKGFIRAYRMISDEASKNELVSIVKQLIQE